MGIFIAALPSLCCTTQQMCPTLSIRKKNNKATTQFKLCFQTSLWRNLQASPPTIHPLTPSYNSQLLRRGRWPNFAHMFLSSTWSCLPHTPDNYSIRVTREKNNYSLQLQYFSMWFCICLLVFLLYSESLSLPRLFYAFIHFFIWRFRELYLQTQLTPAFLHFSNVEQRHGRRGWKMGKSIWMWVCVCVCVCVTCGRFVVYFLLLPSPLTLSNWIHFALVFV